jgi:hypothetical protein
MGRSSVGIVLLVPLLALAACKNSGSTSDVDIRRSAVKGAAIVWQPPALSFSLSPGSKQQSAISATAQQNLPLCSAIVSGPIAPFLTVSPTATPVLKSGDSVALSVSVVVPADAAAQKLHGEIYLRKGLGDGNANGQPLSDEVLPVDLTIVRVVTAKGVQVTVPVGWTLNQGALDAGGPLSLNNFNGKYSQGGIRPKGGADIDITTDALPAISVQDLMNRELSGTNILSTTTVIVGGEAGTRTKYAANFGGLFEDRTVAVYAVHGNLLYKFFLSYYSDDLAAQSYEAAFDALLNGLTFTP